MTAKNKLICLRNLETYFCEEANNTKTAERVVEAEQGKKSRIIGFSSMCFCNGQITIKRF